MRHITKAVPVFISLFAITSCLNTMKEGKQASSEHTDKDTLSEKQVMANAGPPRPVIIYKTKKDYSRNVPVIMDPEKEMITSYPAPGDLFYKDSFAYPTPLIKGFLLDNRGINERVVFLNMTYEEYSDLDSTPPVGMLDTLIIDKDPLETMFFCGSESQFKDMIKELNQSIEKGDFSKFRRMK